MKSDAATVEQYLAELPADRRELVVAIRHVILTNLPQGFEEGMQFGMISYYIPLESYPDTYNGQPLGIASLANQKRHMALYLMGIYANDYDARWFQRAVGRHRQAPRHREELRALPQARRRGARRDRRGDRTHVGGGVHRRLRGDPRRRPGLRPGATAGSRSPGSGARCRCSWPCRRRPRPCPARRTRRRTTPSSRT